MDRRRGAQFDLYKHIFNRITAGAAFERDIRKTDFLPNNIKLYYNL